MDYKLLIRNGVVVAVIMTAAFLSQPTRKESEIFGFKLSKIGEYNNPILTKTNEWIENNVYDKFKRGVEEQKESLEKEVAEQKKQIEEKSEKAIRKFIADKILDILNVKPEELQSLQCPQ